MPRNIDAGRELGDSDEVSIDLENADDERDIILNQDATPSIDNEDEANLGANGDDSPPLADNPRFVRGELDVKEQMDLAIRTKNRAAGANPNADILPDEPVSNSNDLP